MRFALLAASEVCPVLAGTALACIALACGPETAEPRVIEPFPNRRQRFEAKGHVVGYVSNYSSDSVSVIDLDEMLLLGEVPVGRDPVDIDGPSPLAIDPSDGFGYTVLSYPESVAGAHELAAGAQGRNGYIQMLDLVDLAPIGEKRLELEPMNVAYDAELGLVAVSHSDSARALKINESIEARRATVGFLQANSIRRHEPEATSDVFLRSCVLPSSVAFGPTRERLYVICTGENALATFDVATRTLLGLGPTGTTMTGKPGALVAGPQGLLLANELGRSVAWLSDADQPQVLAEIAVTGVPRFGLFTSDTEALVPTQGPDALVRIDLAAQSIVQEVELSVDQCEGPTSLNLGPQGELWLVCQADRYHPGRLVALDPDSLTISASVALGLNPTRMAVMR